MTDTVEYEVALGWNNAEPEQHVTIRAVDYPTALLEARRGWGKAWPSVLVTDPTTGTVTNCGVHRTDKHLTPEQWLTQKLAPPVEVAIVNVDTFAAAIAQNIAARTDVPNPQRPVWILLNGMLYTPRAIALDEHGGIVIVPAEAPSGVASALPAPPPTIH